MKEGQFEGVDFLVRAGRAVTFPIYKDSYERLGVVPDPGTIAYRDETIQQSKDLRRAVDAHRYRPQPPCLLRRELGRRSGPIMVVIENRIKVAVLVAGACDPDKELPEADSMNLLPTGECRQSC